MSSNPAGRETDSRITYLIEAVRRLLQGQYDVTVPTEPPDDVGRLGRVLEDLASVLHQRYVEVRKLDEITEQINTGLLLDEILDNVYESFSDIIPYNRIGFSLIDDDGETLTARWARSDRAQMFLEGGYQGRLSGSSLKQIIETGRPRILNDLDEYLAGKPESESTALLVREGMRSSLTCPLIANGVPVGFMFFTSVQPNAYDESHIAIYRKIASQLSVIVDKGRLVSEIMAQKEAIEQQNAELQRLNELKNVFLGMAAHDLRSPLANIQLSANLLVSGEVQISSEDRRFMHKEIYRQTRYMLTLIDELLDVSQIESGQLTLDVQPILLAEFLTETVEQNNRLAASKGTCVDLEAAPHLTLRADPFRLRQVLDNLITNAVKFSPPGTTVIVSAAQGADGLTIRVADEGPGISSEDQSRLFQPFGRVSTRPTGGETSTGLGLAISRRVIEAHGGAIGIDDNQPTGSVFWVTLPA